MGHDTSSTFKKFAGASSSLALFMILLGLLTILLPLATRIAFSAAVAWVIILCGLTHTASAFADRDAGAFIWRLLIGLVYITGGVYVTLHLRTATETLIMAIAVIFTIESILDFVLFFQSRVEDNSLGALFDALMTLIMAFLILMPWPISPSWTIGIILGINLMTTGLTFLIDSLAALKMVEKPS